jgi:beta-D-xylosidase 4
VWPGVQQALIQQLAAASSNPIIVLVMGGGQIDLTMEKASKQVGALLWLGYPSMFVGRAVADVLFGRFSPTGRLVTTSYPAEYVRLSMADMSLRPNATTGTPGRTY